MHEVGRYDVFELSLSSGANLANPFTDAAVSAEFAGPEGEAATVAGFHYGGGEWRVRFAPGSVGEWRYEAALTPKGAEPVRAAGEFECVPSGGHGFVRISKRNPHRFEYDDGTPFYPIGQQTGAGVGPAPPFDAPEGAEKWCSTDRETFLEAFDGCINLVRSQLGCGTTAGVAKDVIKKDSDDPDRYDIENSLWVDESCRAIKSRGWAQILIPFQDMSTHGTDETAFGGTHDLKIHKNISSPVLASMERYLRYVVARWGAYTDIWEIYNEDSYCPDDFVAHLAGVIRDADPYGHPVTTNYERPGRDWCEVICLHEYMDRPAGFVPGHLSGQIGRMKGYGQPVIYTEFGNKAILSNYDPVKWRVAVWTAFMMESGIVFWNMSGRRTVPNLERPWANSNAYLGPETRQYFRVLADFTRELPVTLRPVSVYSAGRIPVEPWVLTDGRQAVVYLHNRGEETAEIEGARMPLMVGPGRWRVRWIDPATGRTVAEEETETEQHFLYPEVPPVEVDLAGRFDRV